VVIITELALSEEFIELLKTGLSPRILSARRAIIPYMRRLSRTSGAVRSASLVNDSLSEEDVKKILGLEGFYEICPGWWFNENP